MHLFYPTLTLNESIPLQPIQDKEENLNLKTMRFTDTNLLHIMNTFLKLEARSSNFSISAWSAWDAEPLAAELASNAFAYFKTNNHYVNLIKRRHLKTWS